MNKIDIIKNTVHREIEKYFFKKKEIAGEDKLYADLGIYADDMEELIYALSKSLGFEEYEFWKLFIKRGYYSPPEVDMSFLPKIFHIDIGKLLQGEIVYHTIESKGKDITVDELIGLLEDITNREN
jgi:hypothetical protein